MMGMLMAQQQNEINETLQVYAEQMKANQDREATLKKLQDAIAKTASDMQKNKIQTAAAINKNIAKYLFG
jgi:tRNA uridine 5-carbamoylmethylation protein Kti12